jgi:hypothetical protein
MLDFLKELEQYRKHLVQDERPTVIQGHQPAEASQAVHLESDVPVFTKDGALNRARFHAEAFRTLVAATAESQRVGDSHVDMFHLFMSCTRGSYLRALYAHLNGHAGQALNSQLKMLRARVRQVYQRPVIEEKPFVRDLRHTDIAPAALDILDAASRLAMQSQIEEKHLLAALLRNIPAGLQHVLQAHKISLTALQQYEKER